MEPFATLIPLLIMGLLSGALYLLACGPGPCRTRPRRAVGEDHRGVDVIKLLTRKMENRHFVKITNSPSTKSAWNIGYCDPLKRKYGEKKYHIKYLIYLSPISSKRVYFTHDTFSLSVAEVDWWTVVRLGCGHLQRGAPSHAQPDIWPPGLRALEHRYSRDQQNSSLIFVHNLDTRMQNSAFRDNIWHSSRSSTMHPNPKRLTRVVQTH